MRQWIARSRLFSHTLICLHGQPVRQWQCYVAKKGYCSDHNKLHCLQVYTDSDVSTKYHWARPHVLSPESTATVTWDIPEGTLSGEGHHMAAGGLCCSCTHIVWFRASREGRPAFEICAG